MTLALIIDEDDPHGDLLPECPRCGCPIEPVFRDGCIRCPECGWTLRSAEALSGLGWSHDAPQAALALGDALRGRCRIVLLLAVVLAALFAPRGDGYPSQWITYGVGLVTCVVLVAVFTHFKREAVEYIERHYS
jgi:hypothetical protein